MKKYEHAALALRDPAKFNMNYQGRRHIAEVQRRMQWVRGKLTSGNGEFPSNRTELAALEYLLGSLAQMTDSPRWIPIDERLPDENRNVALLMVDGSIDVGGWYGKHKGRTCYWFASDGTLAGRVSHWMEANIPARDVDTPDARF